MPGRLLQEWSLVDMPMVTIEGGSSFEVQAGTKLVLAIEDSRFYSHGRYSPTREQGTHHFHRLIAEFMG